MKRNLLLVLLLLSLFLAMNGARTMSVQAVETPAIAAPQLKWQHGGCYSSWCETGWYSSPAVADLDGDGAAEVIASPYTLFVLNGEDGTTQWDVDPPGNRTWPGVVVADIDDDGDWEVIVAQGSGYVTVYSHGGSQVWSQRPSNSELRGLVAADLDGDDTLEIIVTAAVGSKTNTWVLEHTGAIRPGWPQLVNDSGYAWGVYNDNATVGDMDGDGRAEIVVPSDVHYINAYEDNGVQIAANAMYQPQRGWGKVGVHVDHAVDLRGYAHCGTEHRPNFAHTPAAMVDVDGDGSLEVVAMGNVYNCGTSPYTSLYEMAFIFNSDRSRWAGSGYDWEVIPSPVGSAAPLSENYNVIESAMSNPVVADLDGDGEREILFASYDGRLHALWLDKTERHSWPYAVHATGPGIRFASEPVVVDLENDGLAEVIFASWPQKGSGYVGKLHVLNYRGEVLYEVGLPAPYGSADWNGALAAPTVANIDADADLELVLNTSHSGVVAYDLPGTANARVIWGTGRGNYQRTGGYLLGTLDGAWMSATPGAPGAGETVRFALTLRNPGPALNGVTLANAIPAGLSYAGNLSATSGSAVYSGGTVNWEGAVPAGQPVVITYDATVNAGITTPQAITSSALLADSEGRTWTLSATVVANGANALLPFAPRH